MLLHIGTYDFDHETWATVLHPYTVANYQKNRPIQLRMFAWYDVSAASLRKRLPLPLAGGFETMPRAELLSPIVWGVVFEVL